MRTYHYCRRSICYNYGEIPAESIGEDIWRATTERQVIDTVQTDLNSASSKKIYPCRSRAECKCSTRRIPGKRIGGDRIDNPVYPQADAGGIDWAECVRYHKCDIRRVININFHRGRRHGHRLRRGQVHIKQPGCIPFRSIAKIISCKDRNLQCLPLTEGIRDRNKYQERIINKGNSCAVYRVIHPTV